MQCMLLYCLQLVRQLQGQEENPFGDDASVTPKKIFQLLNQVTHFFPYKKDVGFYFLFNGDLCQHIFFLMMIEYLII